MAKITISDLGSNYASTTQLNAKYQQIEDELNNKVLYRDNPTGEPNSMQNDLDMNSNDDLNAANVYATGLVLNGQEVTTQTLVATAATVEAKTLTSGQTVVTFTNDISNANFYLNGNDVDNGRLRLSTDYTINVATKTITLTESYPADTVVTMLYYTGDEVSTVLTPSVTGIDCEYKTTVGGETTFTLSTTAFAVGTNNLAVYRDGLKMRLGRDYTETSTTQITLDGSMTVVADEEWEFVVTSLAS